MLNETVYVAHINSFYTNRGFGEPMTAVFSRLDKAKDYIDKVLLDIVAVKSMLKDYQTCFVVLDGDNHKNVFCYRTAYNSTVIYWRIDECMVQ